MLNYSYFDNFFSGPEPVQQPAGRRPGGGGVPAGSQDPRPGPERHEGARRFHTRLGVVR